MSLDCLGQRHGPGNCISDHSIERIAGLSQIPQSDLAGFVFANLDPSGSPIVSLRHTNSDIYALDMDWP